MSNSDESLYESARRGNKEAFFALYERYAQKLFYFILKITKNRADAEEVIQETFLRTFKTKALDFQEGSFRAWVFQVAYRLSLNKLRDSSRKDRREELYLRQLQPSTQWDSVGEIRFSAEETRKSLADALEKLPAPLAEVYRLRALGLSYQDIAHALQINIGTVKSRMHSLVERLKKEMQQ